MPDALTPAAPAPWRARLDAALARSPDARDAQLATVRADGRPAVRTVRFRGFTAGDELVFTTDARSAKVAELAREPSAELCWYFPESMEQFRVRGAGRVTAVPAEPALQALRAGLWEALGPALRRSFAWPVPGLPRAPEAAFDVAQPAAPPPCFALLLLVPDEVEHLELAGDPFARTRYRRSPGGWTIEPLNP